MNVRDGLGKGPYVTCKILDVVLPFAIWIVRWFPYNPSASLACSFAMAVNVFHTHHHVSARHSITAWLHEYDSSVANIQLRAMAAHSNAQSEPNVSQSHFAAFSTSG